MGRSLSTSIAGPDGQRKRRTLGTYTTRKEADRAEREALASRDRGIDLPPRTVTLGEVFDRFMRDATTRLSPTTCHRYAELWRLHGKPSLGVIPIGRLRPAHLADLYARLGSEPIYRKQPLHARTVHHVHRLVRVFSWAEKLNLVGRNVVRSVDAPRPGPSMARALTPDEAATVLAAAERSRLYPFSSSR